MSKLSLRDGEYFISSVSTLSTDCVYLGTFTLWTPLSVTSVCFGLLSAIRRVNQHQRIAIEAHKTGKLSEEERKRSRFEQHIYSCPVDHGGRAVMSEVGRVCAHLKTCRPEAGVCGPAPKAKLSQHPHHAKVVSKQQLSSHRLTAKAASTIEDFQMYSVWGHPNIQEGESPTPRPSVHSKLNIDRINRVGLIWARSNIWTGPRVSASHTLSPGVKTSNIQCLLKRQTLK